MATIAEKLAEAAVTDNLNRNEDPLAGEWALLNPGKTTGKAESGKGWTPKTAKATGDDHAYWKKTGSLVPGGNYAYAIATIGVLATQTERQFGLWLLRSPTETATKENGYFLRAERIAGNKLKCTIEKWVLGVPSVIKTVETAEAFLAVGARFAIVFGGGNLYLFASKTEAGAYEELGKIADATYTEGFSGVMGRGTGEFSIKDFRTGTFNLEETEGIHKPNAATATASVPTPDISAPLQPSAASATASVPSVELAGGPSLSATEHEPGGLPLPFPSVLANPARLGPPRFTALDRKTLGID